MEFRLSARYLTEGRSQNKADLRGACAHPSLSCDTLQQGLGVWGTADLVLHSSDRQPSQFCTFCWECALVRDCTLRASTCSNSWHDGTKGMGGCGQGAHLPCRHSCAPRALGAPGARPLRSPFVRAVDRDPRSHLTQWGTYRSGGVQSTPNGGCLDCSVDGNRHSRRIIGASRHVSTAKPSSKCTPNLA